MKKHFTTFDIRELLGIQIDCLKDWMNRDYIQPSIQKASGQGTKNLFSQQDLTLIKLFKHLIEIGLSRSISAKMVATLKGMNRPYPPDYIVFYLNISNGKVLGGQYRGTLINFYRERNLGDFADADATLIIHYRKIKMRNNYGQSKV